MTFYAVQYTYGGAPDAMDAARPVHKQFLKELYEQGRIKVSGPIDPADGGGALLILEGNSREEISELMDGDPFKEAGFITERVIRQWNVFFGGFAG